VEYLDSTRAQRWLFVVAAAAAVTYVMRSRHRSRSRAEPRGSRGDIVAEAVTIRGSLPDVEQSWRRFAEGSSVGAASVRFDAGHRGSEMRVRVQHPAADVREDLRRFKQLVETGEIAPTEGQPTGRRTRRLKAV
jgi:hypothetical protein